MQEDDEMRIYCCRPISGGSADEVFEYYERIRGVLGALGYEVLTPLHDRDVLRCNKDLRAADCRSPLSTNHAIFNRDRWMVRRSHVVFANLLGATAVSIGATMELAWAADRGKHVAWRKATSTATPSSSRRPP